MQMAVPSHRHSVQLFFVLLGLAHGLDINTAPAPPDPAAPTTGHMKVGKVVTLIEELQAAVLKDGQEEQAIYDKFACWCEKITEKRAADIETVKSDIKRFGMLILELKGSIATKIAEIRGLMTDIRKNEEGQTTATALRQKENAAYLAERIEMEQATAALETAVQVLKDATSFAQSNATSFLHRDIGGVGSTKWPKAIDAIQAAISKATALSFTMRRPVPAKQLSALSVEITRYAPQSYTIQGILRDMYSSFTTNLETMTHEEAESARNYEGLMATWQEELALLQASVVKKEKAKAEDETQLADSVQGYEDSEAELKSGIELFDTTKASCMAKTSEWSTRKAQRAEEVVAIAKALEILSSDEAKTLFGKAISFVQVGQTITHTGSAVSPLVGVGKLLQEVARKSHSVRLATLAATMHKGSLGAVGHFDEVIKTIDGLMLTIQDEEKRDDLLASTCKEQYQKSISTTEELKWQIKKEEAEIAALEKLLVEKRAELGHLVTEIGDLETDIATMKSTRTDENTKFLAGKEDDLQAIVLLMQAKAVLVEFFDKNNVTLDLLQDHHRNLTEHAPDARFSGAGSRKLMSKGIISFLTQIQEDLEREISGEIQNEEAAQLDFEKRLDASNTLLQDLNTTKINLEQTIADRDEELLALQDVLKNNQGELVNENTAMVDLKKTCDTRIEGLSDRKKKRAMELEALGRAKSYLAGSGDVMSLQQTRIRGRA